MDEGDSGAEEPEESGDGAGPGSGVPTPEPADGDEPVDAHGDAEEGEADGDEAATEQSDERAAAPADGDDGGEPDDESGADYSGSAGAKDAEAGEHSGAQRDPDGQGDAENQEVTDAQGDAESQKDTEDRGDTDAQEISDEERVGEGASDVERATEVDAPADEIVFEPGAGPHEPEGEGPSGESPDDTAETTAAGEADTTAVDGGETPPGDATEEVPVPGGSTPSAPTSPEPGGDFGPGAPDDEEMPLAAHIEEMIKRLAVVIVIMAIVSAITFPFADRLINFLWYSFLPGIAENCPAPTELANSGDQACPRLYHPLSLMLARLKTASLLGLVIALPVFVYETYLFMRPGLYPNERRYYLAAVPTSLVLAGVGIAFAYFLVLPVIFTYFLGYSMHAVDTIAFSLSETFDLILLMMGLFAVVFQIPLFMMLAIMMGVTTRRWLVRRRIYFWGGFLGLAFLFSPDPTGMAPFIVAITMVVLFEGTLLLLRWTGR